MRAKLEEHYTYVSEMGLRYFEEINCLMLSVHSTSEKLYMFRHRPAESKSKDTHNQNSCVKKNTHDRESERFASDTLEKFICARHI
jgi:hypothetical protein